MKIYDKYILPKRLNKEMGSDEFNETRKEVAGKAVGIVLEIGAGSGYNFPFYNNIQKLYALEPSKELYDYSKERAKEAEFPIEYLQAPAEKIPLADNTVDTVVSTWTLCSVSNLPKALKEIYRILKPEGKFIFVEHGKSPKKLNYLAQRIMTPLAKHFTGNCHMDREIDKYILNASFEFEEIIKEPEEGRPLMFSYRGIAYKKDKTLISS
jgi:ubiquinone/menaquinone biosynthesis C-methylase UbiE